jgi:hypothetical protein
VVEYEAMVLLVEMEEARLLKQLPPKKVQEEVYLNEVEVMLELYFTSDRESIVVMSGTSIMEPPTI